LARLFLETRKRSHRGKNFEKVYWVRIPVRGVSIAWKLSAIEERRQDQHFFLDEEIAGTTATTPEKLQGLSPGEDGFCNWETK
jgi:hypothetical protein